MFGRSTVNLFSVGEKKKNMEEKNNILKESPITHIPMNARKFLNLDNTRTVHI